MKPRVFVGSSVEGLPLAYAVQQNLEFVAEVTVWPQSVFQLSRSTLDSLLATLDESDCGIFVFTADDVLILRGQTRPAVRDNVLFELGLFIGRLGPGRSFFITPRDQEIGIPSDLIGVTPAQYTVSRSDGNLQAALGSACNQITRQLKLAGSQRQLRDKGEITEAWRSLLGAASRSVRILAGDASWAPRDLEVVQRLRRRGVDIRVLSEDPGPHYRVRENLAILLRAGIATRIYARRTAVRAMVVDWDSGSPGAALRVSKAAKSSHSAREGEPGSTALYDYRGLQYFADNDREIAVLTDLFDALYAEARDAIHLERAPLGADDLATLISTVGIDQYSAVSAKEVQFVSLTLDDLWSCCRYVKLSRVERVRALVLAYGSYGLTLFEPAVAVSSDSLALQLPPIVERHDGKYVVIDGMHRLFTALVMQRQPQVQCLEIKTSHPLPSRPIPFSDVTISARKRARSENFPEYVESHMRRVKFFDAALQAWASKSASPAKPGV